MKMVPMAGWSGVAFAYMLSFNTAWVQIAVGLSEKIEKVSYTTPKNGWSRLTKHDRKRKDRWNFKSDQYRHEIGGRKQ